MNHDEILEMLRRSGVEVPGGAEHSAEEPIDVEVEVEDIPAGESKNSTGGEAPSPPASARRPLAPRRRPRAGNMFTKGAPFPRSWRSSPTGAARRSSWR